jgi:hypothetical protein
MRKITSHLWFDKEAREAAEFYTSVIAKFKGHECKDSACAICLVIDRPLYFLLLVWGIRQVLGVFSRQLRCTEMRESREKTWVDDAVQPNAAVALK